jgi:hypothetical protein
MTSTDWQNCLLRPRASLVGVAGVGNLHGLGSMRLGMAYYFVNELLGLWRRRSKSSLFLKNRRLNLHCKWKLRLLGMRE